METQTGEGRLMRECGVDCPVLPTSLRIDGKEVSIPIRDCMSSLLMLQLAVVDNHDGTSFDTRHARPQRNQLPPRSVPPLSSHRTVLMSVRTTRIGQVQDRSLDEQLCSPRRTDVCDLLQASISHDDRRAQGRDRYRGEARCTGSRCTDRCAQESLRYVL